MMLFLQESPGCAPVFVFSRGADHGDLSDKPDLFRLNSLSWPGPLTVLTRPWTKSSERSPCQCGPPTPYLGPGQQSRWSPPANGPIPSFLVCRNITLPPIPLLPKSQLCLNTDIFLWNMKPATTSLGNSLSYRPHIF